VTPRISAAIKTAGHVSTASALATPNLVTKRIGISSPFILARAKAAATGAIDRALIVEETCHDAGKDANHNHYETDAKRPDDYFERLIR
jgi:hypothetical protein